MGTLGKHAILECKVIDQNTMSATSSLPFKDGLTITTHAVGDPVQFTGSATLKSPDLPPLALRVDSSNVEKTNQAGDLAKLGQQSLLACQRKMGPSV